VGLTEELIRRYVKHQEKMDKQIEGQQKGLFKGTSIGVRLAVVHVVSPSLSAMSSPACEHYKLFA
jgi:hypothetical protein